MGLITKVRGRLNTQKTGRQCYICGKYDYGKPCGNLLYGLFCQNQKSGNVCSSCYNFQNPETLVLLILLPLVMGRMGLMYAFFLYQYPVHTIYDWIKKWSVNMAYAFQPILKRLLMRLDECENSLVKLNFYPLMNQMIFLSVCQRALSLGTQDKMGLTISLYSLLFFNAFTYCFSYIKELIEKEDWNMKIQIEKSNVMHLSSTVTKIVLEWTKAVTFIVTVVCMLLVLGLEKGLENYAPTPTYIVITFLYYCLTEKTIQNAIPNILIYIPNARFQDQIVGLEKEYAALAIKIVTSLANLIFLIPSFSSLRITFLTLYVNVWLQYKSSKSIKAQLDHELELIANFRLATDEELSNREEDLCVICFCEMQSARVTPCQHYFHTNCLRLCVKNLNNSCPICKRDFHFD